MLPPCIQSLVKVECGTLVRITSFEPLLSCDIVSTCDGNLPRYVVQVVGVSRFRALDTRTSDAGYTECLVSRIEDTEVDDRDWDPKHLEALIRRCRSYIQTLLESIPESARKHFERTHGEMPVDACELSFWLAEFLPLNPYTLYQILPLDSVVARLTLLCSWMDKTNLSSL